MTRLPQPWTAAQRGVLIALLICLLLYLTVRRILNPVYVSDPQPLSPPRANELQDRIDPNTADWQTLAVLPLIGEKRAKDIIAFRQDFSAAHPGQFPFAKLTDLLQIRGVGQATITQLEPFLIFPQPKPPTTQ